MRKIFLSAALLALCAPLCAQEPARKRSAPEIVKAAPAADWSTIAPDDLLVMTLSPDAAGQPRQVILQLLPPPFSQGWIGNMRKLAAAHWWDGGAVYRVQDNWVAQFGDPDEDTPKAKRLPAGLAVVPESEYVYDPKEHEAVQTFVAQLFSPADHFRSEARQKALNEAMSQANGKADVKALLDHYNSLAEAQRADSYAPFTAFYQGFPLALSAEEAWPTHCYASVGVGRNNSPDTGTGAELYAVIGTPPRQLDRNIAVVGRVIEGIEHLSSLPRGPAPMGMYNDKSKNTPILSIRLASTLPPADQPRFQYLATDSASFKDYVEARVNRRDSFYIYAAGSADICNIPVPIRRAP